MEYESETKRFIYFNFSGKNRYFALQGTVGLSRHSSGARTRKWLILGVSLTCLVESRDLLISYERAFKMLENDMYITGIGQVVLELLSFKVRSGNHQRGISSH